MSSHDQRLKILVLEEHADAYAEFLQHLPDEIHYATRVPEEGAGYHAENDEEFEAAYDVLLAQPDLAADYLRGGGRVAWVQSSWAGVRPLAEIVSDDAIIVSGIKELFGPQIAEYVFCLHSGRASTACTIPRGATQQALAAGNPGYACWSTHGGGRRGFHRASYRQDRPHVRSARDWRIAGG